MQNLRGKTQKLRNRFPGFEFELRTGRLSALVLFSSLLLTFSCSIPNLEKPECTASRNVVKEFYSYHFGNDMKFTSENLKSRERFLSAEFAGHLERFMTQSDPFTLTDDLPKAFSVSGCNAIDENKADVRVLLFWRDDTRSEQREIHIETVKENDKWLIDNIYNDQTNLESILKH